MNSYQIINASDLNSEYFAIVNEDNIGSFNRYQYRTGINMWYDHYQTLTRSSFHVAPEVAPVFFDIKNVFDKLFAATFEKESVKSIRFDRNKYTTSNESNAKKGYYPCKNFIRQVFPMTTDNGFEILHNTKMNHYVATKIIVDHLYDVSDIRTIKWLVQQGANPNNRHLLRWAIQKGYIDIVKYLIEGIKIDYQSIYQYHTELSMACYEGHQNIVEYLIKLGMNVNDYDNIALQTAANRGHSKIFEYLLLKSSINNKLYQCIDTMITDVCSKGHLKIIDGQVISTLKNTISQVNSATEIKLVDICSQNQLDIINDAITSILENKLVKFDIENENITGNEFASIAKLLIIVKNISMEK
ncbi:putative ankyrin repeat protein [Powai lake megavirus]|uniref:Putative ankyrin repeat protein n=1 Tax=Powai lake megavirus TaxID=1842663 RepID=A0A167RPV1_9VIRU|nr:putative ankyrin repeat protein [Powai lake megavirus]ANB50982.1 putative ankyrin repeat protein [Powai lake megavirus]